MDRRDVWVGLKLTARLRASLGRQAKRSQRTRKTTLRSEGTSAIKKYLTEPTLLEISGYACRLRRSTQHLLEVYLQEFEILMSFWVVDSSAARPGRPLSYGVAGECRLRWGWQQRKHKSPRSRTRNQLPNSDKRCQTVKISGPFLPPQSSYSNLSYAAPPPVGIQPLTYRNRGFRAASKPHPHDTRQ